MKHILNKRGSSIIEAAVIMPCIVLAMVSIVLVTVNSCRICITQCSNHSLLLNEGKGTHSSLEKTFINMKAAYISQSSVLDITIEDRIYVIDERKTIMYKDFFDENIVG